MGHKTIGMLGGTTPESTAAYYRYLTHEYARRFGDLSYPEILIYSVNFQQFIDWDYHADRADLVAKTVSIFDTLKEAGADFGLMTANTLHIVFDEVTRRTELPLISIVQTTLDAVRVAGLDPVGLLGTLATMSEPFYSEAFAAQGITVLVPEAGEQRELSRIIYEELSRGEVREESRRTYLRAAEELRGRGARGLVLGCTELGMVLEPGDVDLPCFDTLEIHADRVLRIATGGAKI